MTKHQAPRSQRDGRRGGWRRWSAEEGANAVARWRASGLSAREFAAREGVSAQRLYRWSKLTGAAMVPVSKRAPAASRTKSTPPVPFVQVTPPSLAATSGTLRLEHAGVSLVVREDLPALRLAELVSALRSGASRC